MLSSVYVTVVVQVCEQCAKIDIMPLRIPRKFHTNVSLALIRRRRNEIITHPRSRTNAMLTFILTEHFTLFRRQQAFASLLVLVGLTITLLHSLGRTQTTTDGIRQRTLHLLLRRSHGIDAVGSRVESSLRTAVLRRSTIVKVDTRRRIARSTGGMRFLFDSSKRGGVKQSPRLTNTTFGFLNSTVETNLLLRRFRRTDLLGVEYDNLFVTVFGVFVQQTIIPATN